MRLSRREKLCWVMGNGFTAAGGNGPVLMDRTTFGILLVFKKKKKLTVTQIVSN